MRSPKKNQRQKVFQAISNRGTQKKVFANFPRGFWRFPTKFQSRGLGNFRGLEASRLRIIN